MDELEIERGYADFHRCLNSVLRKKDVKAFKARIARHPMQAGRLSHCLGLSDELAEVEMFKAILLRSALSDLHKVKLCGTAKHFLHDVPIMMEVKGRFAQN